MKLNYTKIKLNFGNKLPLQYSRRKKFYLILRNRSFNFVSLIRSDKTFRRNINLFDVKKSPF